MSGLPDLDLNERLHVDIGQDCNNNCIFCMEEDRAGRRSRVGRFLPGDIRSVLERNGFRREVMFVSGEPTLCRHFLRYVSWARSMGYESVGVITNGRRFAYAPFARSACEAGLNQAVLSIHGPNSRVHDSLTRSPGSFDQTLAGICNLSDLRGPSSLRLYTSTVLNRRNATAVLLDELVDLLLPRVDQMVFNIMQPFGRGYRHLDRLMLPYQEMAEVLGEFFRGRSGESVPIYLVDIPYCVTEGTGIPDGSRGYVERYVHFEAGPIPDFRGEEAFGPGYVEGGAEAKHEHLCEGSGNGTLPERRVDSSMAALHARHRDHQERGNKVKRETCRQCAYDRICDGVWRNYVEHFGFDEFRPVTSAGGGEKGYS